ncbi:MAG: hypothetical protein AB1938_10505 [Myxococcota bacterium]
MTRITLAVVAVAVFSSCGGPGSMSGTVAGIKLDVKDAIFALVKNQQGQTEGLLIALSDKPDGCASLKANRQPKNLTAVSFSMVRYSDMGSLLAPDVGDYTVINSQPSRGGNYAAAYFTHTDTNCTSTISDTAATGSSGIISLKTLKGEANGIASGTYDVTFGASDKVTGSFNATFCDIQNLPMNPNCE